MATVEIVEDRDLNHDGKITPKEVAVAEAKDTITSALVFVTSALTLVAGLAWNDFITGFFRDIIFPEFKALGVLIGQLLYAIVITIVAVIAINRLRGIQRKVGGKSIK